MQIGSPVLIPHQKHLREIVEHDVWPRTGSQSRCLSMPVSASHLSRLCESEGCLPKLRPDKSILHRQRHAQILKRDEIDGFIGLDSVV